jgi:hypothetical protein
MTGESQKIERILTEFSLAFVATAKDARLRNADAVMVRRQVPRLSPRPWRSRWLCVRSALCSLELT